MATVMKQYTVRTKPIYNIFTKEVETKFALHYLERCIEIPYDPIAKEDITLNNNYAKNLFKTRVNFGLLKISECKHK